VQLTSSCHAVRSVGRLAGAVALALAAAACGGYGGGASMNLYNVPGSAMGGAYGGAAPMPMPMPMPNGSSYAMSELTSNGALAAGSTDTHLVNPWGIVFATGAPVWVANNATQTSTLYDGSGHPVQPVVSIPAGLNGPADPTGIVANPTGDFMVTHGMASAPSQFIFDGEGGTLTAWSSQLDMQNAFIVYDDGAGGAVYKGLAIATDASGVTLLYATDFHNGKIDVFDKSFHKVATTGGFADATLPAGYAPFGIQALTVQGRTLLYVTYAQQDAARHGNINGAGLGLIEVFDTQGTLESHLVGAGGKLDAPWGIALAPAGFGALSNELLIGNFGDGLINAFDPVTGAFGGTVSDANGEPIANPGLWGIAFGNGAFSQPTTTLYIAVGVANGADGLYARIDLAP